MNELVLLQSSRVVRIEMDVTAGVRLCLNIN